MYNCNSIVPLAPQEQVMITPQMPYPYFLILFQLSHSVSSIQMIMVVLYTDIWAMKFALGWSDCCNATQYITCWLQPMNFSALQIVETLMSTPTRHVGSRERCQDYSGWCAARWADQNLPATNENYAFETSAQNIASLMNVWNAPSDRMFRQCQEVGGLRKSEYVQDSSTQRAIGDQLHEPLAWLACYCLNLLWQTSALYRRCSKFLTVDYSHVWKWNQNHWSTNLKFPVQ